MTNKTITKEMVNNYLGEDYHEYIANILRDICNDENDINHLRKEIIRDWNDHLENSKEIK